MSDPSIQIRGFTGLNVRESKNAVKDTELTSVMNFDLGATGQLIKRSGFEQLHGGVTLGANSVHVLGFFSTAAYKQIIARSGNELYYSTDGIAWTIVPGGPWADVEWGVQYTDKFYMVRSTGTVIVWTGVVAASVVGSPSGTYCRVFKDRLFVLNTLGAGVNASRLRFSEPFDFTAWPAVNYVGVGEGDGDWLIAVHEIQDMLLVFKANSTYVLFVQGDDFLSWVLRPFRTRIGCISKYSLVPYQGFLYFAGPDGIYTTNGSAVDLISSPVGPYFELVTVALATVNTLSAFIWDDKYVISLPTFANPPVWSDFNAFTWNQLLNTLWAGGSTQDIVLVYHILNGGWTLWDVKGFSPHRFVTVANTPSLKGIYSGTREVTGKIVRYGNDIYLDNEATYVSSMETKQFDFGKPTEKKRGKWIGIEVEGSGTYETQSVSDRVRLLNKTVDAVNYTLLKASGPGYFLTWRFGISVEESHSSIIHAVSMYLNARDYRPVKVSGG